MAQLSRREEKALKIARSANARASNIAAGVARQADRVTGFAIALGAAAGVGYYMARYSSTSPQWFGFDKEIWITGVLAGIAFYLGSRKGKANQASAHMFLTAAMGVGSGYMYAWGSNKGETALAEAA